MRPTFVLASILATLICLPLACLAQSVTPPAVSASSAVAVTPSLELSTANDADHPALNRPDLEAWLDGYISYALARANIPGAVVVVVKDGKPLLEKGYGYADLATHKPVDAQTTLFRPGSISKLFTWTAVMQLVEAHKLDLDADVNQYLDFKIPPYEGKPITLRNIMTHTSGIEEHAHGLITTLPKDATTLEEYVKTVPTRIFAPGTTPSYSNYATSLAGYIVQRVSGESYDDYIDQHIFAPLGMVHASFRQPVPKALLPDLSEGYVPGKDTPVGFEIVNPAPAGSATASGADMGRFMIAHLQNGAFGDHRILSEATAKEMHSTALDILPPLHRMVLGFYEANTNGRRVIAHAGDLQAFHSDLYLFLDDGVGLFVSFNSPGKEGVAGKIRVDLFNTFANRYLPGPKLADGKVDPATAKLHAQQMEGTYEGSRRADDTFISVLNLFTDQSKVLADGKGSIIVPSLTDLSGDPIKWQEIAPYVWRDINGNDRLAAKVVDGKVQRYSAEWISPFMLWEPVPWWRSAAWLKTSLILALGALLLTVLAWPISALVRRRYKLPYALVGADASAHRVIRVTALVVLATVLAYAGTVVTFLSNFNLLTASTDWLVHLLRLMALFLFPIGALVSVWNAAMVLRSERVWTAKLWAVVLVLSLVCILWVGLAFHMMGYSASY
ncbi:class A beta-lactamase-related serine hydrolase [Pseudolysobacter antarcticus]|uniref:Class A beta-lactamase-related serine hydrolase n=1 Tax=Pseudolysobacter antarcticus TaxID=2511995 RepID=A0A411HJR3_9GAMM|nr:serine hydrolase domain-containing protein [Pseudolysobacter antarcticus]QBB70755.1 class A beta-lactamase-related serine hydrolase [Pseudolysobacter antarcticus]